MEDRAVLAPELETTIAEALDSLDRASAEARIHDDPLRFHLLALAGFLKAQRQLYVDGAVTLGRELREARAPAISPDEVRRGVIQGVSAHMARVARVMSWRTWLAGTGMLLAVFLAGGVSGYLSHSAAPMLAGVHAGAERCEDRQDGSRLCWIPVWERLPPQ